MRILKKLYPQTWAAWVLLLILALVIPSIVGGYLKSILILVYIWIIMAISLNLIYGFTVSFL